MWIESHQELRDHPKTRRLARALGVGVPAAIGHLHCLWWWALDYAPDGSLAGYEAWEIADAALWDGDPEALVAALAAVGFLDGGTAIHDWDAYGGKVLMAREKARRRAAKARSAQPAGDVRAPYAHAAETSANRAKQITRDDMTGEENDVAGEPPAPPAPRKRETQFPKTWTLTPELLAWATGRGWPETWVREITEEFATYWQSRTTRRADWDAAWRTWLLKEARTRKPAAARPAVPVRVVDWSDEAAVFGTGD